MILKSEKIHNQEQLISILKNQLDTATAQLTKLVETDSQIASKVAELELLLTQHPDYQSVVSDRFSQLPTPEPTLAPVRIEIESIESIESVDELEKAAEHFKADIFPEEQQLPPAPAPKVEKKIESPYSSKAEVARIEAAFNKISENRQQSEPKIITSPEQKVEISPEPSPTLEANEVVASESDSSLPKPDSTEVIFDELQSESLKERMLGCKNRSELEKFKVEIGSDKADKVWDSCSIIERNLIKCANAAMDKKAATPFDLIQWRDVLGKLQNARYVGFYLHGLQIKNEDDRVIYLINQDIFKVVDKRSLKAVAAKSQKPCPPELVVKLEKALSEPEDTEDTAPTAEEISQNNFTGLAPAPKPTGIVTGNKPDSTVLEQSDGAKAGDIIEVHDKDSALNGKTVEVTYTKPDGTVNVVWENKNYFVPASGYKIFSKGLGLKKA